MNEKVNVRVVTPSSVEIPSLSVVIPALDEAENIEATLMQLQPARRMGLLEVILADGGSTDNTQALSLPWVDQWVNAPKGRASQLNAGAAVAKAPLLLFLHADTQLPDKFYEAIVNAVNEDLAWGRFDVDLTGRHPMFRVIAFMMNWRSRLTGIATGDQAIFITRDLFSKVGGFPSQRLMEDIEISRGLKKIRSPICLREKLITSSRKWEKQGIWRTIWLMWQLRWAYFWGASPDDLVQRYYPRAH